MYYKGDGNFTTDQPLRAITSGLISRFGTLDPTDGSSSERASLSAHFAAKGGSWKLAASGYYIHSRMTLWNNFTHFLDDPVNGDQEAQNEDPRHLWRPCVRWRSTTSFGTMRERADRRLAATAATSAYVDRVATPWQRREPELPCAKEDGQRRHPGPRWRAEPARPTA